MPQIRQSLIDSLDELIGLARSSFQTPGREFPDSLEYLADTIEEFGMALEGKRHKRISIWDHAKIIDHTYPSREVVNSVREMFKRASKQIPIDPLREFSNYAKFSYGSRDLRCIQKILDGNPEIVPAVPRTVLAALRPFVLPSLDLTNPVWNGSSPDEVHCFLAFATRRVRWASRHQATADKIVALAKKLECLEINRLFNGRFLAGALLPTDSKGIETAVIRRRGLRGGRRTIARPTPGGEAQPRPERACPRRPLC